VRTFLVVEDKAAFARAVSRVLSKYGRAIQVATLEEAETVIAARPHLSALIVDLHLPDGDGLAVLRKFREKYPNQPALVLTGYPDSVNINAAYDLDADFVAKPFHAARLHQFLRSKVLQRHRHGPAGAAALLTDRERAIINRARQGLDDKSIARDLGIAPATVRWFFANASAKFGALSRRQLLEIAEDLDA
jgi:DNA-binding NarL/FixJ family response regulator